MQVKCINAENTYLLKLGEIYEVSDYHKTYYEIMDGENYGCAFSKSRFKLLEEEIKIETSEKAEALINAIELSKLQQENAELKKALELVCRDFNKIRPFPPQYRVEHPEMPFLISQWVGYYLEKTKEATDGK